MLDAKDMVLWTNRQTREVMVQSRDWSIHHRRVDHRMYLAGQPAA
jgi:hypothetical protein